jgi:hypothetical protein
LQFHVPALRISTKLTFKLKPEGSKHIFKAIEDVVLTFTDNLRDDLASIDQNQILQEFATMNERAVQSLEEWQEFVDEWKATLISRLSELHKQVLSSNEKALAAQASEKEVSEQLRVKDVELNALLMKEQMQIAPPPSLPQGSRRPSNATNQSLGIGASIANRFRRPSNVSVPSSSISEANETSPKELSSLRRRLSFQNVMSGIGSVVGNPMKRKSDNGVNITAVPISELHPDLVKTVQVRPHASVGKDSSIAEMSSCASSASSLGSRPVAIQEESTGSCRPSYSSKDYEDEASSVSSLSLPDEDTLTSPKDSSPKAKRSVETEVVHVRRPMAEKGSQCFVPVSHRAVQCTLHTEIPQSAPIGFKAHAVDYSYVKHRGAGTIPATPRLPAIRQFASTQR